MRKLIFILTCLITYASSAQEPKGKTASIHESVKLQTDLIFNNLVKIRRDLHENPELAGNEVRTQKIIAQHLLHLGLEVDTNIYGHGVVGILKGGKKGKKIAWRSDMDALSNEFADEVPFKSKTRGIQHGCGHDIHMAIGLGIAEVLAKDKAALRGTVYFIFQPEEETFIGAKGMINDGLFSKIKPDEIYGLHVTALPVGQIMAKPNEMFAYQKRVRIQLKNELPKEETKILTEKIRRFLFRAAANSRPWEIQHMVDPKIGLSNPNTIFKNYRFMDDNFSSRFKNGVFSLEAYLYETNPSNLKDLIPRIRQAIEDSGYKEQLLSVSFIQENPTVINDKKLTNMALKTLENIYRKEVVLTDYGQVPFFNDDFTYFQQKVPGVYFFLGGSNPEKEIIAMNHSPNFEFDEESIRTGVRCFSSLILERLIRH